MKVEPALVECDTQAIPDLFAVGVAGPKVTGIHASNPATGQWIIGLLLFWIGLLTSYTGYMVMDDGLSGTGLRIAWGIILSVPVVGTWLASSIFGGEFPGDVIIGRLYILHVLLLPELLVTLISVQVGLVFRQSRASGRVRAVRTRTSWASACSRGMR